MDVTLDQEVSARSQKRFPDFLRIGAQKAGTSWLYDNLRSHPQVWLPPVKELHYFNYLYIEDDRQWTSRHRHKHGAEALRRHVKKVSPKEWNYALIGCLADIVAGTPNDDWYARIFSLADPAARCGDITPRYATIPAAGVRHAYFLMPRAKIIYILRDPIDRCWSHMRMLMAGKEPDSLTLPAIEKMAQRPGVLDRAGYSSALEAWSVYAREGRFLTLFFDDIAENPAALLREVCAFLEIEYEDKLFPGMQKSIHAGSEIEMPPQVHSFLKSELRPVYQEVARRFPERGLKWLARHFED
jgi:hypothetical protein